MQENADEREDIHLGMVKSGKTAELEIFVHTAETSLFSAIGHVDICYQGRVISYGNYDPSSETLFGMVGDGVLYFCDRDKYIDLCKRESQKTLFGYGIDLTPEMEKAVQKKLAELKQLTIPWEPSADKIMTGDGKEDYTYAYKIRHETDGELYKFIKSKFKSYFVLSTNCVLLADTIVGQAGTDILSPKGFIAPGTYQAYLNREFEKPNSIVVSKHCLLRRIYELSKKIHPVNTFYRLVALVILNASSFISGAISLFDVISTLIYGAVIAFVLNVPMKKLNST